MFHLSLIGQHWWVLLFVCWGFVLLVFVLPLVFVDQSLRPSCLPMTSLAQLSDCHSCYDERSIDQQKNLLLLPTLCSRPERLIGVSTCMMQHEVANCLRKASQHDSQ